MKSSGNCFKNQNSKVWLLGDTEGTFNGNIPRFGKNWNRNQLNRRKVVKVKFKEKW